MLNEYKRYVHAHLKTNALHSAVVLESRVFEVSIKRIRAFIFLILVRSCKCLRYGVLYVIFRTYTERILRYCITDNRLRYFLNI